MSDPIAELFQRAAEDMRRSLESAVEVWNEAVANLQDEPGQENP